MTYFSHQKRVTWRVLKRNGEWVSVVLIGEAHITQGPFPDRKTARADARSRAATVKEAGR